MAYVNTETLKRNIRVNFMTNVDVDGTVTVENAERYFLNMIDKTSTVDVVEVKHGKYEDGVDYLWDTCPNCLNDNIDSSDNYCPHCGQALDWEA